MRPEDINYDLLPEECKGGMRRYIEEGILPGDFLLSCIANDFIDAVCRADRYNRAHLLEIAWFIHNEMPMKSHGSRKAIEEWNKKRGLLGK